MMWIKKGVGIACFILIATPLNGQTLNFLPNLNNTTSTQNTTSIDSKAIPTKFIPLNTEDLRMIATPSIEIIKTPTPNIATKNTPLSLPSGPFIPAIPGPKTPASWNKNTSYFGYANKDGRYPDVKSDGFLELAISNREHTTDLEKLDTIRNDEVYQKIPIDVIEGSTKFDMRYDIGLEGKLDDDLTVYYDIQKEPDFPGKFNIRIEKGNNSLQFGDFDTNFGAGDFINVKKSLEGAKIESVNKNWNGKIATGKTKSEPQKMETFGTGERTYNLGKQYILEDSVVVFINNNKQTEYVDYTVNYFDGKVTFTKPITKVDFIKVIYEFTNPIQDFIPSLSRKSFTGAQFLYEPNEFFFEESFIKGEIWEELITTQNPIEPNQQRFILKHPHVILGSETVYLNGERLTHKYDYFLKHRTGTITLQNLTIRPQDRLRIKYSYIKTKTFQEVQIGANSRGPYFLNNKTISPGSEKVIVDGKVLQRGIDYTLDHSDGKLYFNYKIQRFQTIKIDYIGLLSTIQKQLPKESPLRIGFTYLDESSSVRNDVIVERVETPSLADDNITISTDFFPIEKSRPIIVSVSDVIKTIPTANINYYTGTITLPDPAPNADSIKVDYFYRKSFTAEALFQTQAGRETYTVLEIDPPKLPIRFNGISRVQLPDGRDLLEGEQRDYVVEYLDEGQDIRLTFITNQLESQLTSLPANQTIKVTYKYTPDSDLSQGKSQQQMFDLLLDYKVNEKWKINTEYAYSFFDFSKNKKQTSEIIPVNSTTVDQQYTLTKKPVVIDSENIFLNGFPLARDKDYFINYDQGTVRFKNLSLSSSDEMTIKYEFFENNKAESKSANALKFGTTYQANENVLLKTSTQFIEPAFRSIGALKDEPGTLAFNSGILWNISASDNVNINYDARTKYNDDYNALREEKEFSTSANIAMFNLDTTHSFRFQELETTGDVTEKEFRLTSYENSVGFGPTHLRAKLSSLLSQKIESFNSDTEQANSLISGFGSSLYYKPSQPFLLKSVDFSPYIHHQKESTERFIKDDDSSKITDYYGLKSNAVIIKGLDNALEFEKKTLSHNLPTIETIDDYYNYSNVTTYYPFSWITTSYAIDHEEDISPIPGKRYRISDNQTLQINQLGLYSGLKYIKAPSAIYRRFSGANATGLYNTTQTIENNALKQFKQSRQYYTLTNFSPYKWMRLNSASYEVRESETTDKQVSSVQQRFDNALDYSSAKGKLTLSPRGRILERFTYEADIDRLFSNSDTIIRLNTGTETSLHAC